jgi:hypothetical protein
MTIKNSIKVTLRKKMLSALSIVRLAIAYASNR